MPRRHLPELGCEKCLGSAWTMYVAVLGGGEAAWISRRGELPLGL